MESAFEHARHQSFLAQALAVTFAALAVAPFFLAFHGAPTAPDVLIFAFALLPVAAAMLVARTGRLTAGHVVCFCSLVGVSITLFVGVRAGAACALAWLVVAQLGVALSFDKALERVAGLVTGAAVCGIVAAAADGGLAAAVFPGSAAWIAGLAVVQASMIAHRLLALADLAGRSETDQSDGGRAAETLGDAVAGFDAAGSVMQVSPICEALVGAPERELMRTRALSGPRHGIGPDIVAVLRDISAPRRHDLAIEAARPSIDDAIRAKDYFLANMSHELRTPLNAIIGFSEMLGSHTLRPADPDKQREYARIINQSGQHLLSLVNSILDMSKIQSGTFTIVPEPFDVVPLIDLCCDMVTLKACEGRLRLVRDYPDALEEVVGDKRACKQILINLLSNAVKFTPEQGQVTIKARPEGTAFVVTVTDTGIGIAAADLARLGDPFFQARSSPSRPYEGTGLGLSVVRGLIGLHGGTIAIESEVGKGTCVTIRLPLNYRGVRSKGARAPIETIARRRQIEPASPSHDRRMKQIA